jgi:hypothetical protein
MKKAGIVIDSWKEPIFERHLKQGGYVFEKLNGPASNMLSLFVETTNLQALAHVVKAANDEAAQTKGAA